MGLDIIFKQLLESAKQEVDESKYLDQLIKSTTDGS
jgi:hypothetical protein